MLRIVMFVCLGWLVVSASPAQAKRFALLIGNRDYAREVGPLKNPVNDVKLIAQALRQIGFADNAIRIVENATFRRMDVEIRRHADRVRRAGSKAISFVYYSGHGIANPETQSNYLVPVDLAAADENLWYNAIEQRVVINHLRARAPNATHYVVFDACRDELNVTGSVSSSFKSFGRTKGFVPIENITGMLIAYATAPGQTASDVGQGGGPYAKALAAEIVRPGFEAVSMFRRVHLKIKRSIGQQPWLSIPPLPEVYFAGREAPDVVQWTRIQDSDRLLEFERFVKDHPASKFAATARLRIRVIKERSTNKEAAQRWERLENSENISDLELYAKRFPTHPYAKLAQSRILALQAEQARKERLRDWQAIKDGDDIGAFREFVRVHPESFLARVARDRIGELERLRRTTGRGNREDQAAAAWREIRESQDASALSKFIETYPASPLAALAAKRLLTLGPASRPTPPSRRSEPDTKPGLTKEQITLGLQRELERVSCDPGPVDGDWGPRTRQGLEQFNKHAGKRLDTLGPTLAAIETIRKERSRVCPDSSPPKQSGRSLPNSRSQARQRRQKRSIRRPDPNIYSRQVWSSGSVRHEQRVRRATAYGILICIGGNNRLGVPRRCYWQ